jgi:hypothetical protein
MNAANSIAQTDQNLPNVLLCLSTHSAPVSKLLTELHCGNPLLFHQIMHLHDVGLRRFLLSVDAVPGSLLALVDGLRDRGIDIEIIRSVNEVLTALGDAQILVLDAQIWASQECIDHLLKGSGNRILTVEEHAENAAFERIDLNSRWAGLAVVESSALRSAGDMPEGWDLGSVILRLMLQLQCKTVPLRQADLGGKRLVHLAATTQYAQIFDRENPSKGWLEKLIFATISEKIANQSWRNPTARALAEWSFPVLSFLCLASAAAGFLMASALLAGLAVLAADIHQFVNEAEYRQPKFSVPVIASWVALALALPTALLITGIAPFEAIFVSANLVGLLLLSGRNQHPVWISPLVMGLTCAVAAVLVPTVLVVKLIILAQLLFLLVRPLSKAGQA